MPRNEEIIPLLRKAVEQAAARTPPKTPINKDETLAFIVRRWFQKQKGSPDEVAKTRTRIKDLTSKNEHAQEVGREGLKGELFLTQQSEFEPHLTSAVMEKVLDKVPQPLPAWLPSRAELNNNPFLAEAAARIAFLPDREDPAALYEQLAIMYRSANFSKMKDDAGKIREFRNFIDKAKKKIIDLAHDHPEKKFILTANDDMESPWSKKPDVYRSRRLPDNGDAKTQKLDAYLQERQRFLDVEDPRKEGKALLEIRGELIEGKTKKIYNDSEVDDYVKIIDEKIETMRGERWEPIPEEAPFAGAAGTPSGERGKYAVIFDKHIDQNTIDQLTPDARQYYYRVRDYLREAPNGEVTRSTLDQFVQRLEMLSRGRAEEGRTPESDAAIRDLIGAIENNLNTKELQIPTSIYLDRSEVREILDDFPGWAERYMRKIELLIAQGGTDNPALRPAMDRFNLAQEFYGGEFFNKNLVSGDLAPDDIRNLEKFFTSNYQERVSVLEQYRVRLLHVELENQLSFVRDWDMGKQDMMRVRQMAEQLGDQGLFGMRGYYGQLTDVAAKDYLLPTMREKIFPLGEKKARRWTPALEREVIQETIKRIIEDREAFNPMYTEYMFESRWKAKGTAYVDADQRYHPLVEKFATAGYTPPTGSNEEKTLKRYVDKLNIEAKRTGNPTKTSNDVLIEIQSGSFSDEEGLKKEVFRDVIEEKRKLGELNLSTLDKDDGGDETIEAIVRNAMTSARLQFQVKEQVAESLPPMEASLETGFSAFVFTSWEERLLKADRFWTNHKMRWGATDAEKAMWKEGNNFLLHEDDELKEFASEVAGDEWKDFKANWKKLSDKVGSNPTPETLKNTLSLLKNSLHPADKELQEWYTHIVEKFWSYEHANEIGSPTTPDSLQTYEFFADVHKNFLGKGKKIFTEQIICEVASVWQEDRITRAYNYWKSGERTRAMREEFMDIIVEKGRHSKEEVANSYLRGQTLFSKAREYFFPGQKERGVHNHKSKRDLIDQIRGNPDPNVAITGLAATHPLEFIQLQMRVEITQPPAKQKLVPGFNKDQFTDAERRFHMIQGVIIAKTAENPNYVPIDYSQSAVFDAKGKLIVGGGLNDKQVEVINNIFDTVPVNGVSYKMNVKTYLDYMQQQSDYVYRTADHYTDLRYANKLGREILFYDDVPEGIVTAEDMKTAISKGASNLFPRAIADEVYALNVSDMTNSSLTTDVKTLHESATQIEGQATGYTGMTDANVAKALVYARYAGYTRGHIDLRDVLLRNKMMVSKAQEIGKSPAAPANSPLELEQILGEGQKTNRIENISPAFGEALESFAGVSSWSKVTGGADGPLAAFLGPRNYHKFIRYFNDRLPTHITLLRFRNTLLFFGITVGLFIVKQTESGGEDRRRE